MHAVEWSKNQTQNFRKVCFISCAKHSAQSMLIQFHQSCAPGCAFSVIVRVQKGLASAVIVTGIIFAAQTSWRDLARLCWSVLLQQYKKSVLNSFREPSSSVRLWTTASATHGFRSLLCCGRAYPPLTMWKLFVYKTRLVRVLLNYHLLWSPVTPV